MTEISKEYASALFAVAKENDVEKEYEFALERVSELLRENPEYVDFLASPCIPKNERTQAIEQAFASSFPEYIVSFLKILCEKGHIRCFDECMREYKKIIETSEHVSEARVVSAVELNAEQKEKLRQKLEKMCGNTVKTEYFTDQTLMGGMVIELDGKVIDGSLRSRLSDIKDVMNG